MERALGHSFAAVRVFAGRRAEAEAMGARAAAWGETVVFGEASPPRATVAHELAHVVQARLAGSAGAPVIGPEDDAAEREAQAVAREVASGGPAPVLRVAAGGVRRQRFGDDLPPLPALPDPRRVERAQTHWAWVSGLDIGPQTSWETFGRMLDGLAGITVEEARAAFRALPEAERAEVGRVLQAAGDEILRRAREPEGLVGAPRPTSASQDRGGNVPWVDPGVQLRAYAESMRGLGAFSRIRWAVMMIRGFPPEEAMQQAQYVAPLDGIVGSWTPGPRAAQTREARPVAAASAPARPGAPAAVAAPAAPPGSRAPATPVLPPSRPGGGAGPPPPGDFVIRTGVRPVAVPEFVPRAGSAPPAPPPPLQVPSTLAVRAPGTPPPSIQGPGPVGPPPAAGPGGVQVPRYTFRGTTTAGQEVVVDSMVRIALDAELRGVADPQHLSMLRSLRQRGLLPVLSPTGRTEGPAARTQTGIPATVAQEDVRPETREAILRTLRTANVGRGENDRVIIQEALTAARVPGAIPAYATADRDVINGLFRISTGAAAGVADHLRIYQNVAEYLWYTLGTDHFTVHIEGRPLAVYPLQEVRADLPAPSVPGWRRLGPRPTPPR